MLFSFFYYKIKVLKDILGERLKIFLQPDLCLKEGISLNMKNYYEILQVSHNASKEVIEKAYKVLAKKYHPDLQTSYTAKTYAEQRLKEINEAYNVLSDDS